MVGFLTFPPSPPPAYGVEEVRGSGVSMFSRSEETPPWAWAWAWASGSKRSVDCFFASLKRCRLGGQWPQSSTFLLNYFLNVETTCRQLCKMNNRPLSPLYMYVLHR